MPADQPSDEVPAGMTTLRTWADRHGRTYDYVRQFWRRRQGFPKPAGELEPSGRHGGGRGEFYYDVAALEQWLAGQLDLHPPERIVPSALRIDPDERITLGRFAGLIGRARNTVAQYRDRPGFPQPDVSDRYRAGDLIEFWNSRPGRRGKARRADSQADTPPPVR
jgi:hypothetical protein